MNDLHYYSGPNTGMQQHQQVAGGDLALSPPSQNSFAPSPYAGGSGGVGGGAMSPSVASANNSSVNFAASARASSTVLGGGGGGSSVGVPSNPNFSQQYSSGSGAVVGLQQHHHQSQQGSVGGKQKTTSISMARNGYESDGNEKLNTSADERYSPPAGNEEFSSSAPHSSASPFIVTSGSGATTTNPPISSSQTLLQQQQHHVAYVQHVVPSSASLGGAAVPTAAGGSLYQFQIQQTVDGNAAAPSSHPFLTHVSSRGDLSNIALAGSNPNTSSHLLLQQQQHQHQQQLLSHPAAVALHQHYQQQHANGAFNTIGVASSPVIGTPTYAFPSANGAGTLPTAPNPPYYPMGPPTTSSSSQYNTHLTSPNTHQQSSSSIQHQQFHQRNGSFTPSPTPPAATSSTTATLGLHHHHHHHHHHAHNNNNITNYGIGVPSAAEIPMAAGGGITSSQLQQQQRIFEHQMYMSNAAGGVGGAMAIPISYTHHHHLSPLPPLASSANANNNNNINSSSAAAFSSHQTFLQASHHSAVGGNMTNNGGGSGGVGGGGSSSVILAVPTEFYHRSGSRGDEGLEVSPFSSREVFMNSSPAFVGGAAAMGGGVMTATNQHSSGLLLSGAHHRSASNVGNANSSNAAFHGSMGQQSSFLGVGGGGGGGRQGSLGGMNSGRNLSSNHCTPPTSQERFVLGNRGHNNNNNNGIGGGGGGGNGELERALSAAAAASMSAVIDDEDGDDDFVMVSSRDFENEGAGSGSGKSKSAAGVNNNKNTTTKDRNNKSGGGKGNAATSSSTKSSSLTSGGGGILNVGAITQNIKQTILNRGKNTNNSSGSNTTVAATAGGKGKSAPTAGGSSSSVNANASSSTAAAASTTTAPAASKGSTNNNNNSTTNAVTGAPNNNNGSSKAPSPSFTQEDNTATAVGASANSRVDSTTTGGGGGAGANTTTSAATVSAVSRGKDKLLEEYRAASETERQRFTLEMMLGHVVPFAVDSEGSRGLQRLLTEAFVSVWNHFEKGTIVKGKGNTKTSQTRKQSLPELASNAPRAPIHLQPAILSTLRDVFIELEQHMIELVFDAYANYVVQRFIETQSVEFLGPMVAKCRAHSMYELSKNDYGCRVIQNLLEACAAEINVPDNANAHSLVRESAKTVANVEREAAALVLQLNNPSTVQELIRDRNGNHVIQKCLMFYPQESSFIARAIAEDFLDLAKNIYGCRVIQCVFEQLKGPSVGFESAHAAYVLMLLAMDHCTELANSQYGNFVVTHALINSPEPSDTTVYFDEINNNSLAMDPTITTSATWSRNSRMSSMALRYYSVNSRVGISANSRVSVINGGLNDVSDELRSPLSSAINASRITADRFGVVDSTTLVGPASPTNTFKDEYIDPNTVRHTIVELLIPNLLVLSCSKFASNVAQRLFAFADEGQKTRIVDMLTFDPNPDPTNSGAQDEDATEYYARKEGGEKKSAKDDLEEKGATAAGGRMAMAMPPAPKPLVVTMMTDQYANYVIQRILEECNTEQKATVIGVVSAYALAIAKSPYGKHIINKLFPQSTSSNPNAQNSGAENTDGEGAGGAAAKGGGGPSSAKGGQMKDKGLGGIKSQEKQQQNNLTSQQGGGPKKQTSHGTNGSTNSSPHYRDPAITTPDQAATAGGDVPSVPQAVTRRMAQRGQVSNTNNANTNNTANGAMLGPNNGPNMYYGNSAPQQYGAHQSHLHPQQYTVLSPSYQHSVVPSAGPAHPQQGGYVYSLHQAPTAATGVAPQSGQYPLYAGAGVPHPYPQHHPHPQHQHQHQPYGGALSSAQQGGAAYRQYP